MDEIKKLLLDMDKRLKRIERMMNKADAKEPQDEWLTEEIVVTQFKCSKRKLWELRKSGRVEFKCRPGKKNRDYRYLKSSLEGLYA